MLITEYTVRESARAKHVRLRVTLSDGLVVVVPKGFDRRRIPWHIEAHREWIVRALAEIEAERSALAPSADRPTSIDLQAVAQTFHLDWIEGPGEKISIAKAGPFRLHVSGPVDDRATWRAALRRWLIDRGREHLIPWTEEMAKTLGVPVERITIRCQKTRWGSHTSRADRPGTVSLNAQLLFLRHRLARYVILHELCHAVHPNHSPAFWELVRSREPDADRLRKELRNARRSVPRWITERS